MKNFIFISPNFPMTYWKFCAELKKNGMRVLGIGDSPYENLLQELRDIAQNAVDGMSARRRKDQGEVCKTVRAAVSSYLFKHTKRSPMVIPMVTML